MFPPESWVTSASLVVRQKAHQAADSRCTLKFSLKHAEALAAALRQWSGKILDSMGGDSESKEYCQIFLEDQVARLDEIGRSAAEAAAQTRNADGDGAPAKRRPRDTGALVHALCASMHLRDRSKLAETFRLTVKSIPALSGFASILDMDSSAVKLPTASMISKSQIFVDAALCCYYKSVFEAEDWLLFLWADSSPQGGYDWLMSLVRMIKVADLDACMEASHMLEKSMPGFVEAAQKQDFLTMRVGAAAPCRNASAPEGHPYASPDSNDGGERRGVI